MAVRILDSIRDPGPCPAIPAEEEPTHSVQREQWRSMVLKYGRWLDAKRRFALAEKVKLLEAIPEEKRTLVESIVFLMAMDLLANDLQAEQDIFSFLRM
jgi:hypothetical protein